MWIVAKEMNLRKFCFQLCHVSYFQALMVTLGCLIL